MKAGDINAKLVEGFTRVLDVLNPKSKLELISKLVLSVTDESSETKSVFKKSFGAFSSRKTAEEIIAETRQNRNVSSTKP